MRAAAMLGAVCLALVSCADEPQPSPAELRPFVVQVHEADFILTWRIDGQRVSSADPLRLEATLLYTGPMRVIKAWAGFSLVNFYLQQVDGPLHLELVIESIGICHDVRMGEVVVVPYRKSGDHAEQGDPNFPVMNEFLHFPPGRWRITAIADFTLGGCGGAGIPIHIEAPGEIIVTP
jgi:hypothetical protein